MNDDHTNALLSALEAQRNNALNGQVKAEAALTMALAKITTLEAKIVYPIDGPEAA